MKCLATVEQEPLQGAITMVTSSWLCFNGEAKTRGLSACHAVCSACECMVGTGNKIASAYNCDWSLPTGLHQKSAFYAFCSDFVTGFRITLGKYFDESRTRHICPYFFFFFFFFFHLLLLLLTQDVDATKPLQYSYVNTFHTFSAIMYFFSNISWNYKWQYWKSTILHATCMLFPFILIFTISYAILSVSSSHIFSPQTSLRAKFYFQNMGHRDPTYYANLYISPHPLSSRNRK